MSKRDYLHRKATCSNDDSDWKLYKECRNKVTVMIRKSKENYFKGKSNNCNGDSGRLWKTLKNVLPKNQLILSNITIYLVINLNIRTEFDVKKVALDYIYQTMLNIS